jgi:photosystem II stability/assembly factor-like uncharacterized protein
MRKIIFTFLFTLTFILTQTIFSQVNWEQLPGPYGGEVRCIAVNPVNYYTYFGSNGAGIFRSTDAGNNWSQMNVANTGFINLNVRALAFNSSGHIFAAILDNGESKILRSTNDGANWNYTVLCNQDVRALAINSSGHIFAGTDTNGVYRSTNNGVGFTQINNGLTFCNVTCIAIKSTGEIFTGTRTGGVFRSTNNGDNWTQVNNGLTNTYVNTIAINPVNGYIFIGTGNSADIGAVYRSTNNGGIWTIMGLTDTWIKGVAINNNGTIYAVGSHFWHSCNVLTLRYSTNGGGSWEGWYQSEGCVYFTSLTFNNFDDNVYLGTTVSLYRILNNWSLSDTAAGFTGQFVRDFFRQNSNNYIFAGCKNRGIARSTDNGANWFYYDTRWSGWRQPLDINTFAVNSFGFIFAGGYNYVYYGLGNVGGVVISTTDNGEHWGFLYNSSNTNSVQALTINYLDYIFAGTAGNGIYRSTDNGGNWTQINLSNNNVYSLATDSVGALFAGTGAGKIFRSTDNGFNWSQVYASPISSNNVRCLTNKANNVFYAGLDTGGIIITTDNGTTWTQSNFTVSNVNAIIFNTWGYIFIGTGKNGVYESTDNGASWVQINSGLFNTQINTLVFDNDNYLYCGTNGSSVYRTSQPIGIQNISKEIPSSFSLSQNYPNPFNPSTNIKFNIAKLGNVKIVIYDVLGREITTLVNEQLKPGTYEVNWDGTNYPSGVYYYKLAAGSFSDTKRMVLIK